MNSYFQQVQAYIQGQTGAFLTGTRFYGASGDVKAVVNAVYDRGSYITAYLAGSDRPVLTFTTELKVVEDVVVMIGTIVANGENGIGRPIYLRPVQTTRDKLKHALGLTDAQADAFADLVMDLFLEARKKTPLVYAYGSRSCAQYLAAIATPEDSWLLKGIVFRYCDEQDRFIPYACKRSSFKETRLEELQGAGPAKDFLEMLKSTAEQLCEDLAKAIVIEDYETTIRVLPSRSGMTRQVLLDNCAFTVSAEAEGTHAETILVSKTLGLDVDFHATKKDAADLCEHLNVSDKKYAELLLDMMCQITATTEN